MNMKEKANKIYKESAIIDGQFAIELAMPGSLEEKNVVMVVVPAATLTAPPLITLVIAETI